MRTATLAAATLTGGLLLTACSDSLEPLDPSAAIIQDQPLEGVYDVEVSKLFPVCDVLGTVHANGDWTITLDQSENFCLVAIIEDEIGVPASDGTVTWQVCSRKGSFTSLSKSACERGGDGRWRTLISGSPVNGEFILGLNEGFFPPSGGPIGFRYIYRGQGSGIANHTEEPFDVTVNVD